MGFSVRSAALAAVALVALAGVDAKQKHGLELIVRSFCCSLWRLLSSEPRGLTVLTVCVDFWA